MWSGNNRTNASWTLSTENWPSCNSTTKWVTLYCSRISFIIFYILLLKWASTSACVSFTDLGLRLVVHELMYWPVLVEITQWPKLVNPGSTENITSSLTTTGNYSFNSTIISFTTWVYNLGTSTISMFNGSLNSFLTLGARVFLITGVDSIMSSLLYK
jgi:hypothetical protein